MLIMEIIVLCAILWGICYLNTGSDEKNIKSYATYPDEIQNIVKENANLSSKIKTNRPWVSFFSNVVVFSIILFVFGFFLRDSFPNNFLNILILGQVVNAFDFLVIDMLWWRNTKRIRFSGTEDQGTLYKCGRKHFVSFLKGILVFIIVAFLDSILLSLI